MIRFVFIALVLALSMDAGAQPGRNPFDLQHRLAAGANPGTQASSPRLNPFDVAAHRPPEALRALPEVAQHAVRPALRLPSGRSLGPGGLLGILLLFSTFLAFSIANNRPAVARSWRSFLNANALAQAQREASGLAGNTPYMLLYASFVLNAGLFFFLVMGFFKNDLYFNLPFLLICTGASGVVFLSKHVMLLAVANLFPVRQDVQRYNFLITVFNCVLGFFLLPFNFLIAFSSKYADFLLFWTLGLIAVFYVYRAIRAVALAGKFLKGHQFHFLLYLCTVEIAPVLVLVKLALLPSGF